LKVGDGIALHMPTADNAVMKVYAAAGDKFTGNANFIVKGTTFHFHQHQLVVVLIVNMKGLSPGNSQCVSRFSFHSFLLSLMKILNNHEEKF
jgi:hypothetical protein